ncbi:MAG: ATP synthase F1 subunit delta [Epulopiscium sp. Nuni2H_MBin001]|nr:MAG: ATP synthase F1 subunit delta [Epulopiscium sp. Nuni2H_MBin001]
MATIAIKRYASALYDLAKDKDQVAEYEQEAVAIKEIIENEPDFMTFLTHPSIVLEEKLEVVQAIFGGNASEEFVGLFVLLIKKRRQNLVIEILDEFIDKAKIDRGFIKATVTSAVPLNEKQVSQIRAKIEKGTQSSVELTTFVDESVLGGIVVRVGDKVVDGSIKGEMNALKNQLK